MDRKEKDSLFLNLRDEVSNKIDQIIAESDIVDLEGFLAKAIALMLEVAPTCLNGGVSFVAPDTIGDVVLVVMPEADGEEINIPRRKENTIVVLVPAKVREGTEVLKVTDLIKKVDLNQN